MSELVVPKGWELKTLIDISAKEKNAIVDGPFGSNLVKSDYDPNGIYPVLTIKMLYDITQVKNARKINKKKFEELQRSQVRGGDLLVAKIGNTYGLTCIYPKNFPSAMIPANLCKITPNEEVIDIDYLKYWLDSCKFKFFLDKIVNQSAQPAFGITNFKKLPIPVPIIEIQKQIVAKLDNILGQLEEKKKQILTIIENNKQRIDFFEKNWLSYVIDREIKNHPDRKQWDVERFGDIINIKHGHQFRSHDFVESDGYKILKIGQLKEDNTLNLQNCDLVSKGRFDEFRGFLVKKGDILMALTGATLGKTVLVSEDIGTVFQNYRVGKFELKNNNLAPEFLFYLLQSSLVMDQVFKKINRAAIGNIGKENFENISIIFPKDKKIQEKIITNIKSAEEKFQSQKQQFQNIRDSYESTIKYIEHMQSAILDAAFSGKLVN